MRFEESTECFALPGLAVSKTNQDLIRHDPDISGPESAKEEEEDEEQREEVVAYANEELSGRVSQSDGLTDEEVMLMEVGVLDI